jgi:hypothetical protein
MWTVEINQHKIGSAEPLWARLVHAFLQLADMWALG